jgi:hypothetical protein
MKKLLVIVGVVGITAGAIWKSVDSVVIKKLNKEFIEEATEKGLKSSIIKLDNQADNLLSKSSKSATKRVFREVPSSVLKQLDELGFIAKKQPNGSYKIYSNSDEFLGTIRGNQVSAMPGNSLKTMNKLLDARRLFPNFTYKVDNVIYKTDNLGRVEEVLVPNFPRSIARKPRSPHRQGLGNLPKNGIKGVDQGGHLVPNQLGGISEVINIVPQNKALNNGKWKQLEKTVADNHKYIKNYRVRLSYTGKSARSNFMQMSYTLRGKECVYNLKNAVD